MNKSCFSRSRKIRYRYNSVAASNLYGPLHSFFIHHRKLRRFRFCGFRFQNQLYFFFFIEEIEGAYEQKLFQSQQEDSFSGIRSFVLPKGSYQLAAERQDSGSTEDAVTFYVASEENFAEITSSDEHAVLEVNQAEIHSACFLYRSLH